MAITHPFPAKPLANMPNSASRRQSIAEVRAALESVTVTSVHKTVLTALDVTDLEIARVADLVSARIQRYASGAPSTVKDEALIRGVAWLRDTYGAERVVLSSGPASSQPAPVHSGPWFRQCGAMAMLSPWRVRNAGVVEEET